MKQRPNNDAGNNVETTKHETTHEQRAYGTTMKQRIRNLIVHLGTNEEDTTNSQY
jgi:hypothetical protein